MRRLLSIVGIALAAATAVPVLALSGGSVEQPARVLQPAVRFPGGRSDDVISVYNVGALRPDVATRAAAAARAAGGSSAIGRSASTGMQRVLRQGAIVQQAPTGFAYPMATTILPGDAVVGLMGNDVAAMLTPTTIVMGKRSAEMRGAQAGDVVDLVGSGGSVTSFTISAVVADDIVGGTELLLSIAAGERLGITRESRVVMWGFGSRASIDAELVRQNLVGSTIRIRRTWDAPDPDDTIGMAATKALLGEFAYRVEPSGAVSIDSAWRSANITPGRIGQLNLPTGCHRVVRVALQQAMDDVIASGLENTLDYSDANRYGGCYVPRFDRQAPNSTIGNLSRHTWGQAIDTNTQGSCQGCAPPDMNCDTVRIFRRHGFAWGGNFLNPDGMHFEWVGQRRDIGLYPSRFCPNTTASTQSQLSDGSSFDTFFAEDGMFEGD